MFHFILHMWDLFLQNETNKSHMVTPLLGSKTWYFLVIFYLFFLFYLFFFFYIFFYFDIFNTLYISCLLLFTFLSQ